MKSASILQRHLSVIPVWSLFFFLLFSPLSLSQTGGGASFPVSFQCGDHSVSGIFYPAIEKSDPYTAILLHGFPPGESDLFGLGEALSKEGINALTFTYSGTFKSGGAHTYAGTLTDIEAAIGFLSSSDLTAKYQIDTSRLVLIGHCYGGAMALNYAARHPEIRRVIALEPVEPGEFAREYLRNNRLAAYMDSVFDALMQPAGPVNFHGKADLKKNAHNPEPFDLILNAPKIADRDILLVTGWDDPQTTTEAYHMPFYRALKKAGARSIRIAAFHTNHAFRGVREDLAGEVIRWIVSK